MVKKFRFKFVAVTMSFLTVIFGLIFFTDFLYEDYLYRQYAIQLLDSAVGSRELVREIYLLNDDDYFPEIFAAKFD